MFTPDDIRKLCELARLELTAAELPDVTAKLTSILAMVGQLQEVDTTGVTPMAHPLDRPQRMRDDVVTETDRRDFYQQNAAHVERGLYLVPKVLD